jgi:hypothetical protein
MHEMEHLLTVYASKAARNSVADFLGFCEVGEPKNRLTKGLWLVSRWVAHAVPPQTCCLLGVLVAAL